MKRLFIARYRANVEEDSNYRELDIIKQKKNEGFTEFYNRWRSAAARMVNPPDDPKSIRIIIDNLQEEYKTHLRFLPLNSLRSLYEVGINIKDYLMKKDTTTSNQNNHSG